MEESGKDGPGEGSCCKVDTTYAGDVANSEDTSRNQTCIERHSLILCISILAVLFFQSINPPESYLHEYLWGYKGIPRERMHHDGLRAPSCFSLFSFLI